jgi:hypothetical protein
MRHEEKLEEYLKRLCDADEALADTRRLTPKSSPVWSEDSKEKIWTGG